MQQLTQKLRSGEMIIQEVPKTQLGKGMIQVRNHYSLISAGTEGSTVKTARKSLLGKAKERPQQVKQVLEVLAQQGPVQTLRAVNKKLDAYSPLGYSCAGEVIGIGEGIHEFEVGDMVACAGAGYANHAEIISVPKNLSVKLDKKADLAKATYNTMGAIALQGVRQADLRLGESCAIIGLGLLGQLAALMLRASGVRVIGIDINKAIVELSALHSVDLAMLRQDDSIEQKIIAFTNGLGVDAVIIAAASDSLDPVNFAGSISRKKGKVVILGDVPTGFDRNPHYYKKELELKMACSYGPGRYDLQYEEKGIDYPAPYVRWTEKRNMEAFQQLIQEGKINLSYLTTHEFNFEEAPKAYDLVINRSEPYLGILLKYDVKRDLPEELKISLNDPQETKSINIAFIGAGSYAQGNLLPNIPIKSTHITRMGILTNSGTTSKRVAEKFRFEFCTSDEKDILQNKEINTVFIATRHDSHAEYVIKCIQYGKHIFVEKPLCLNLQELDEIKKNYTGIQQLMVGFNRRFSPLSVKLKQHIDSGPMSMIYRINAGHIPGDSWIQNMEIGGGRIIGEVCHFIDYLTWLNGSLPVKVYASALPDPENNNDTVNITFTFANGSTGIVAYYANGAKSLPKEQIEVFYAGTTGIIRNFKSLEVFGRKKFKKKLFNQDKGQRQMVKVFLDSILTGKPAIPFQEIEIVTRASFAVLESIKTGLPVSLKVF